MGEEVRPDDVVAEWEDGLPSADDLTPLSQSLIPPELASAFKISPEPPRTAVDVHRASQTTLSSLRSNPFPDPTDIDGADPDPDPKKPRRAEEVKNFAADEDQSTAKNSKKPRLVWTPELHKRFIEVVAHLGLKNAVPKTIMQLMNVEGLTRENVASHLQKYRLYVRRQGYSDEGPLPSDHRLFASAQQSFAESSNANNNNSNSNSGGNGNSGNNHHNHSYGHMGMPIPMPYHHHHPQMMQMPIMSSNGHGFHGYHHHVHDQQQYSGIMQQQSDWSGNSSKYNKQSHHTVENDQ